MGLIQKRKTDLLLAFMLIILLFKTNRCTPAFLVKSNASYGCKGHLNECRIAEALDSELGFDMVMDSDLVRILQSGNTAVTGNTGNRNAPAQRNCPSPQYASCLARGRSANCRGTYCRG
ncbi:hypothetical protein V6N13_137706 [Hibiscus sabdariffa]|uniref:Uncharacterized protein n=1 Tax=Hibiscus sabdariffa TaxID=183260 RepID=A0ABR2DKY9_9ROSI